VAVGPVLLGTRRPVQVVQYGSSVDEVVNLAAVGAVQAGGAAETEPVSRSAPVPRSGIEG
jgi:hypothetical protein